MSDLETLSKGQGADARAARRTLKRRGKARAEGRGDGSADFAPLIEELEDLASQFSANERKAMASDIANMLKSANAGRIKQNIEPSGEPMQPRKLKKSGNARTRKLRNGIGARESIKGGRMFQRAIKPAYLRKESSAGAAQVGFVGAMARIMRVHQDGLRDTVTRDPNSPAIVYPKRVVLGMTPEDRIRILERVTAQLQP